MCLVNFTLLIIDSRVCFFNKGNELNLRYHKSNYETSNLSVNKFEDLEKTKKKTSRPILFTIPSFFYT